MPSQKLNYATLKAAAKQLGGKTLIFIPRQTFLTRISRVLDGVECRDVTGQS
jgi:hypothetical protein